MTVVWLLAGALVGWIQAVMLLRGARRGAAAATMVLRVALVAAVLVPAALVGQVLAAAIGWLVGHLVSVALLARGLT